MTSNGAVFFLGNRAHYQVLEQSNNSYTNSNGNQEMVNSNIPIVHGNYTTKHLSNYGNSGFNDTLVKPTTSTYPSLALAPYDVETNNVVLNHSTNEAYFANTPNSFTHNEETQCYSRNEGCKEAIINIDDDIGFSLGNGVKHRSKKYGTSNGSSEFILNDNDDLCNLNPSDLNGLDNDNNKNKLHKRSNRTFTASALLRALMARRRRRPDPDPPTPEPYVNLDYMSCTYRDSCRCLDCQSRYFECDDDDDDDNEDFLAKYLANEYNASHQDALSDYSNNDESGSNSHCDGSNSHYGGSNSHYGGGSNRNYDGLNNHHDDDSNRHYEGSKRLYYEGSNSHYNGLNSHHDGSHRHYNGSNSHYVGSNGHHDSSHRHCNGSNSNADGPSGQCDVASVSETVYRTSDDDSVSECLDLEAGCYEDYLEDTDDEVFLKPTPTKTPKSAAASSTDPLIPAPKASNPQPSTTETEEEKLEVELAAGAPVFFDHLLNHPFTCCIQ